MAELLCQAGNAELKMETASIEEKKIFNPMSNSSLDSSSLINLGWKGCFNAKTGFNHTVKILKEIS